MRQLPPIFRKKLFNDLILTLTAQNIKLYKHFEMFLQSTSRAAKIRLFVFPIKEDRQFNLIFLL